MSGSLQPSAGRRPGGWRMALWAIALLACASRNDSEQHRLTPEVLAEDHQWNAGHVYRTIHGIAATGPLQLEASALFRTGQLRVEGRQGRVATDGQKSFLHLEDGPDRAIAWLPLTAAVRTGTVAVELRGRNIQGGSFVGIAFNAVDDTTYEAVYLRPFHFASGDSVRQRRMVQYIAHPAHTWHALRDRAPGVYESGIARAPGAEEWVTLRLEVDERVVSVFVNGEATPALVVPRLAAPTSGRVGLWIGNPSSGDFRGIRIERR
jgi:hypothetical protein